MSAAEKLKELADKRYQPAATADVRSAVPQIVAVVEAAERLEAARHVTLDRSETMDEHETLADTLAALDEELS